MVLTQLRILTLINEYLPEFPYHYGSHATGKSGTWIKTGGMRFHTTMVLTQRYTLGRLDQPAAYVSIPLWFSRNALYDPHFVLSETVSIPLWFSRNHPYSRPGGTITSQFPYHYGSHATAFITKILYRFWVGRINQMGRFRKRHRIYISAIRLDLIIDGLSAKWREKASVSSKEDRSQRIPVRHSLAEAYRRKLLPIPLSIK